MLFLAVASDSIKSQIRAITENGRHEEREVSVDPATAKTSPSAKGLLFK
jgi:hypothetical protein